MPAPAAQPQPQPDDMLMSGRPRAGEAKGERKVELFASVAVLLLGQSMRGGAAVARVAPALAPMLAAAAPVLSSAPSLLAMIGLYRVAQRPLLRAGEMAGDAIKGWVSGARDVFGRVGKEVATAASVTAEIAGLGRLPSAVVPQVAHA